MATSEPAFLDLVKAHGIYLDRIKTIKGFYSESLSPVLQRAYVEGGHKVALATVDCDFYDSAIPVFEFIDPLLQEGSVVYVDDLFAGYKGSPQKGVFRAFREWKKRSRWKFERHLDVGWWGRSYIAYSDEGTEEEL